MWPRPKAKAKAAPAPQPKAKAQARHVVQEPDVWADDQWLARLLARLPGSSAAHASSMMIDDPAFCEGLASQLRAGSGFSCTSVVDEQIYDQTPPSGCRGQKARLSELKRLGAEVFLAKGFRDAASGSRGFLGTMHVEIVVVEYPVVAPVGWMGGANITKSSRES